MSHNHNHDHHHSAPHNFNLAFAIAIGANLIYTLIQIIVAYHANSSSLLADAGHNLGDVLALAFAWISNRLLLKPSSQRYTYGFKKTTILASLTNALLLMFTCGVILVDAVSMLFHPENVLAIDVMIVAAIGILVNGSTALLFMRGSKDDLNIKGAFLHLAYDAVISVGVVIAAALIYWTNWQWIDPVMALIIVVVILKGTWGLLKEAMNLIIDAVPAQIDLDQVKSMLLAIPEVSAIHDLHIWAMSTQQNALSAHLVIPSGPIDDRQLDTIQCQLKSSFKLHHITLQIEQGELSDACHHCDEN